MPNEMKKGFEQGTQMAIEMLNQIPTVVMAVDLDLQVTYLNEAGLKLLGKSPEQVQGLKCADLFCSEHCNTPACRMKQSIEGGKPLSARNSITIDDKKISIEYFTAPLKDADDNVVGGLEYVLDITERVRHEERLREQSRTIQEISTPTIKLWDGVMVLPVVGVIDSNRAQQMMEKMLENIVSNSAKVIILDISGVAAVDTAVANHLIKITKATRLMGCLCIVSGVSPAVAQTIVQLGINMDDILTKGSLSDALAEAFKNINLEVKSVE